MRTRVKICGITRLEDAIAVVEQGADAMGLVFYPPSPRNIEVDQASRIVAQIPPFITVVGLFVNAEKSFIEDVCDRVKIDLIQFHGDENEAFCRQFSRPYIKAIRMKEGVDIQDSLDDFNSARAILVDSYKKGIPGGTGETFNWERIPKDLAHKIILAGGLKPENVVDAIKTVGPYAVDVSGGVEQQPGIKDVDKIKKFIFGVNNANSLKSD